MSLHTCIHLPCMYFYILITYFAAWILEWLLFVCFALLEKKNPNQQFHGFLLIFLLTWDFSPIIYVFWSLPVITNRERGIIFLRYWWSEWNPNYESTSIVGRSPNCFCSELHLRDFSNMDFFHWSSKCSISAVGICITTIKLRQEIHNTEEACTLKKLFWGRGLHSRKKHEPTSKMVLISRVGRVKNEHSTVWSCNSCAQQPRPLLPADLSRHCISRNTWLDEA